MNQPYLRNLVLIPLLLAVCVSFVACSVFEQRTPVEITFSCYEVIDGVVQDNTVPVLVSGYVAEHLTEDTSFLINLHLPQENRYQCAVNQQPTQMDATPYSQFAFPYIAMPTAFNDAQTNEIVWGNYALSLTDGYFLVALPSNGTHYFVGSTAPDISPETVLEYFKDFIPVMFVHTDGN